MIRTSLAILLSISLAACQLPQISVGGLPGQSPAPLAQTTIDDTGLEAAWKSFDVALDAINLAIDAGAIAPGSARADAIADAIDKVTGFLTAAELAAAAGSATDYKTALENAKAAFVAMRMTLKGA